MAPIDRRVRLWAWVVRHQGSIASRSEAEVIALQARRTPDNALMPHGYLNFPGVCRSAPQALAELCAEQAAALVQPVAAKEHSG